MMKPYQTEYSVSFAVCFGSCLILLLLPFNIVASIFFAVVIHELCHIGALKILHIPVYSIEICANGTIIHTPPLPPAQEFLCAAAGPAGSFLCLLFLRVFPLFAICGCVQGLYNLLPIYPLDGGRMLRCITQFFFPARTDTICLIIKCVVIASIAVICMRFYILTKDRIFALTALYFMLQTLRRRKIPCKEQ